MANIDGQSGRRGARATNLDLPLVPLIDFLLCLVLFLLAVGSFESFARLQSNANVPSASSDERLHGVARRLHVDVQESRFRVTWRNGATVLVSNDVPLRRVTEARGVRYPELSRFLETDWRRNGMHHDPDDRTPDEAVVHVRNSAAYEDVIAVIDALRAPQRPLRGAQQASVFAVSFAAD